jgi:hypothetical protein
MKTIEVTSVLFLLALQESADCKRNNGDGGKNGKVVSHPKCVSGHCLSPGKTSAHQHLIFTF